MISNISLFREQKIEQIHKIIICHAGDIIHNYLIWLGIKVVIRVIIFFWKLFT